MHPGLREKCGVFGVYTPDEDAARLTFYGLYALQHRGQESAGIATADNGTLHVRTGMGLVAQVFDEEDLSYLPGPFAIGHTRYSTTGSSRIINAQPFIVIGEHGELALAHNGNVVNAADLRREMEEEGHVFTTSSDSEVIARMLVSDPGATWEARFSSVMRRVKGAYSLTILLPHMLIAARDPLGVRPLCVGKIDGGHVVASETCALDHLGAEYVREVAPGEVVFIDHSGLRSYQAVTPERSAACIFENIYFARPDSVMNGRLLYQQRVAMGVELAREHPADADIVIGIPDSATAPAVGYARESGIPFAEGLIKNRYVGRTFIHPDQRIRERGVMLKFNPLREVLEGKRIVVVDDSIVRGTTTPRVVNMLRRAGAVEIHLRICAPPIVSPCYFGVDMASKSELIAAHRTVPEIERHTGADSLGYLSLDGLVRAVGRPRDTFCMACFTGQYPIPVQLEMDKLALERPELAMELALPSR